MKKLIPSIIVGLLGGIAGSLIFQPISGITDIFLSDFAIGGAIVGGVMGYKGFDKFALQKKLMYGAGTGLLVFLVFGLLSGHMVDDLIAGALIGLAVGLVSHFFGEKVDDTVENLMDKQENRKA